MMIVVCVHAAARVQLHLHNILHLLQLYLHLQDAAQDSIEIVIHNVFQMLFQIHYHQIVPLDFQQMALETVFPQQAQYLVHLDLLKEIEVVFQLIQ